MSMVSAQDTPRIDAIHHIRLNRFIGMEPDLIQASVAWFRETQLPVLESLGGFRTIFFGQDLTHGRAAGITFWETEAAMRLSEPREGGTRARAVARAGGSLGQGLVDRYRIIYEDQARDGGPPAFARLARYEGVRPSLISDAMAAFEAEHLPQLRAIDGYRGLFVGANMLLGNTVSVSLWDSAAALQSSLGWERGARSAMEHGAGLVPRAMIADTYEVVLAPALRQLRPWPAWGRSREGAPIEAAA